MERSPARRTLLALLFLPLAAALQAGCYPECVDHYDCSAASTKGGTYTCERNRCVRTAATDSDAGTP